MNLSEFKAEVAALLNRSQESLVVNGQDLIVNAANKARSVAQRMVDFEQLRRTVDVTVSLTTGVDLSTAVLTGTTTLARVNRIKKGVMQFSDGTILPLEFTTKDGYLNRLERRWSYDRQARYPGDRQYTNNVYTPILYRQGDTLFLWPTDTNLYTTGTASVAIGLDCIVKDVDYTTVYEASMIATGALGVLAPFIPVTGGGTTWIGGSTARGTWAGQPLFAYDNGAGQYYYVFYVPATTTVRDYWFLSANPGDVSVGWQSAYGVGGLNSPEAWTGVGTDPSVTLRNYYPPGIREPDLGASFWFDEALAWMQLYVIQFLQSHYIKDNGKWPVTQKMIDSEWSAVVGWNESISESSVPYDLE